MCQDVPCFGDQLVFHKSWIFRLLLPDWKWGNVAPCCNSKRKWCIDHKKREPGKADPRKQHFDDNVLCAMVSRIATKFHPFTNIILRFTVRLQGSQVQGENKRVRRNISGSVWKDAGCFVSKIGHGGGSTGSCGPGSAPTGIAVYTIFSGNMLQLGRVSQCQSIGCNGEGVIETELRSPASSARRNAH